MKRFVISIFFSLGTVCYLSPVCHLQGEIIEVTKFKELLVNIHPETLVLVDIDDTLLIPVQTLGTDVWFISRLDHYLETKKDSALSLDKALSEWEAVRHLTSVKIVEEGSDEVISRMQKDNVVVMGLTTQGLALATRTEMQLKSLSIDLSKTAPSSQDSYFINGQHGVLYRQGILFTSGTVKGEALLKFLDIINYHPKHIVFINDKKMHLQDVEKSVKLRNINFTGLRYGFSDQRVADFREDITDIQWTHSTFGHLLSDEEALSILGMRNDE